MHTAHALQTRERHASRDWCVHGQGVQVVGWARMGSAGRGGTPSAVRRAGGAGRLHHGAGSWCVVRPHTKTQVLGPSSAAARSGWECSPQQVAHVIKHDDGLAIAALV
eukprot:365197-Chlamydomonas_euryale.AAC.6